MERLDADGMARSEDFRGAKGGVPYRTRATHLLSTWTPDGRPDRLYISSSLFIQGRYRTVWNGSNRLILCGSRRTVPGERRVVRRDTGVIVTLSRRYASTPDQSRAPALSHEHVETPHHGQRKSPVVARNLRAVQRSSGIRRFHAILCSAGILQPKQSSVCHW